MLIMARKLEGWKKTDASNKKGFEETDDQTSDIYGHKNDSDGEEETYMNKYANITIETENNYEIGSEDKEKFDKNFQLKKNISNIVNAINTKVKSIENFVSDITLLMEATSHQNVLNNENDEEQEEEEVKEPERNNMSSWFTSYSQQLMFESTNSIMKCFMFYVLKYILF